MVELVRLEAAFNLICPNSRRAWVIAKIRNFTMKDVSKYVVDAGGHEFRLPPSYIKLSCFFAILSGRPTMSIIKYSRMDMYSETLKNLNKQEMAFDH